MGAAALSGEVEESKALLDSSERSKRQLDMEIADARNACNEMQAINGREMSAKRALEGHIHTVQAEIDAMLGAAKNAEEKSKLEMRIRELEGELSSVQSRTSESIKTYQQQIEEAEEIAALNLAKFRKAQQELEETEERSKMAETGIQTSRMF